MTNEDPLRRASNPPPPVPPTTVTPGLGGVAEPRHGVNERLVGPEGEPITPGLPGPAPLTPPFGARIKALDERHKLNVAFLWVGIVASILLSLLVGWALSHQLDQSDARNLRNDTQSAEAQAAQRIALCRDATFLLGLNVPNTRANWPAGPAAFDVAISAVRQSAVDAHCPGI